MRCLWFPHGALNSLRTFSFFVRNFFLTSRFLKVELSTVLTRVLISLKTFSFLGGFFFNISISECRTGASEMSTVLTRRPDQFATIFIFRSKIFFSTSRFLKFKVSTLPTRRPDQFENIFIFRSKFIFSNISISESRKGASEVSAVPTRRPDQFGNIFIFRSKFFCTNILISECRTGASEVSTVLLRSPDLFGTIFILVRNFFFQYLDFRISHRSE